MDTGDKKQLELGHMAAGPRWAVQGRASAADSTVSALPTGLAVRLSRSLVSCHGTFPMR